MKWAWQRTQRDRRPNEAIRIFSRVDYSGDCWLWQGTKRNGYGVNPEHLFIGTPADNSADMVRKGRQARGNRNANTKVTPEMRYAIKTSARPVSQLAKEMGIGLTTAYAARASNAPIRFYNTAGRITGGFVPYGDTA